MSRTGFRDKVKGYNDERLRSGMKELAVKYSRYGYLIREGLVKSRKRTYRIDKEEQLQVRAKKRKKLIRARSPMFKATAPNQSWSMDCVSDLTTVVFVF